jgi:hypothetical protein
MKSLLLISFLFYSFLGTGQKVNDPKKESKTSEERKSQYIVNANYIKSNSYKDSIVNEELKPGTLMRTEEFEEKFIEPKTKSK